MPDAVDPPQSTRPASMWPDSGSAPAGRAAADGRPQGSTLAMHSAASAFGLRSPKAVPRTRRVTALLLARPAMSLRLLVMLEAVVLLVVALSAGGLQPALLAAGVPAAAALAGGLVWLIAMGSWGRRWAVEAPGELDERAFGLRMIRRAAAVGALAGALAGLTALVLVEAPGPGWPMPGAAPAWRWVWQPAAAALLGALAGAAAWSWVDLRAAMARPAEASARLAELQSRIRPHFLFNALNTALALVQIEPQKAETVLEDLAQLFRAALSQEGEAVTLDDEIDLAQRYLAIERLRFGERLQVFWDLDPDAAYARVPPLVLQPLVENAVKHGVEPAEGGGSLWIRTQARAGMAEVEIVNTLPDEPGEAGRGMAQANVAERLKLMHDMAASFDTHARDGRYHARLAVPL